LAAASKCQALEGILRKFSDLEYTRSVWPLAPSPNGSKQAFEDSRLESKIVFVPEDGDNIGDAALGRGLSEVEARAAAALNPRPVGMPSSAFSVSVNRDWRRRGGVGV